MKKTLLNCFLFLIFFGFQASAQTSDYKYSATLSAGISEYCGDLGNGFFKFNLGSGRTYYTNGIASTEKKPFFAGISLARYLTKDFDVALSGSTGKWGYYSNANQAFYDNFYYADLTARWKFLGLENSRITPYFLIGIGGRYLQTTKDDEFHGVNQYHFLLDNSGKKVLNDVVIPVGLGANIKVKDRIYVNVQSFFGWTSNDRAEGKIILDRLANDLFWHHSIGVSYVFGKMLDNDGDKVCDKRDKCLNTVAGALVDKTGCIIDSDKDGIADNLDACPSVAGVESFKGCPDSDHDGIEDSKDKCINVAGITKFDGCPDSDNDGVEDSKDKCPDKAGLSQFSGCPDSDGDGIEDAVDKCPKLKGTPQFGGCPDSDGDGISDDMDNCPAVAGTVANKGCPEIKAQVKQLFERALQGVQFETGKSTLKKQSFPLLDQVAKVMTDNPSYRLMIAGHTDNAGNKDKNLQLSKDRAAEVKKYLESKGVALGRASSEGYGDSLPVADNATKEGKAKNRRVEFKIQFEDFVK